MYENYTNNLTAYPSRTYHRHRWAIASRPRNSDLTGRRLAITSPRPVSPIIVPVGAATAVMPVMMMPVMIVRGLRGRTDGHGYQG
jgi:hypothetical protein